MTPPKIDKVLQRYCSLMEEIKYRTYSIGIIRKSPLPNGVIYESCFLQLRLICETIALACLVAHDDVSASRRSKFMDAYKADWIIKAMEKLHPAFFPLPGKQVLDTNGKPTKLIEIKSSFLTKEELIKLYTKAGNILHRAKFKDIGQDKAFNLIEVDELTEKVINLLNHHQIQLFNPEYQIWVIMQASSDKKVHATLFQKLDNPSTLPIDN